MLLFVDPERPFRCLSAHEFRRINVILFILGCKVLSLQAFHFWCTGIFLASKEEEYLSFEFNDETLKFLTRGLKNTGSEAECYVPLALLGVLPTCRHQQFQLLTVNQFHDHHGSSLTGWALYPPKPAGHGMFV